MLNDTETEIEDIEIPIASTIEDVENILVESKTKLTRVRYNDFSLLFLKDSHDDKPYYVQKKENPFYGRVFFEGSWIHSYPHLRNIKTTTVLTIDESVVEEKVNGTNIGIGKYPIGNVIRTRMSPFPEEFPVMTFLNSTINGMVKEHNKVKLQGLRDEMLAKYPDWYINAGDGEYIGLKVQEVVNHIIDVDEILNAYPDFAFYFELIGKINPIIIDTELEYGFYDFDYKLILLDVYDRKNKGFIDRKTKESVAEELSLDIASVVFRFDSIIELQKAIKDIKLKAEYNKIEGYVLKNGVEIIKIKPDAILESAYRLNALMKGYIYTPDLLSYISRVVTMDHLSKPDEYDTLVDLIAEEARADYLDDLIQKNRNQIRKRLAESMAIMVAIKIMEEQTFEDKGDLFRYLNTEIPIRFEPLKSYIDFELERTTTDLKLKKKMKKRRTKMFSKVSTYCMKNMKED